jgi:membrane-bound metal-dependent hydrolase YbcI (DUF457 family)
MLSHSVPAVLLFSLVGFVLYALKTRDWTAALVVAAVILSHMFLDWITGYKPTWPGGPMIGLRLYGHPVADFIVEGMLIVIGALLYARTLPPRQRPWIDVSIMLGSLLALQLGIDVAHMLLKTLPKC